MLYKYKIPTDILKISLVKCLEQFKVASLNIVLSEMMEIFLHKWESDPVSPN